MGPGCGAWPRTPTPSLSTYQTHCNYPISVLSHFFIKKGSLTIHFPCML